MMSDDEASEFWSSLTRGRLDDDDFDALLPASLRTVSRRHWTPIAVARRAAQLFAQHGASHVLDVGCGPGKFSVIAAEACGGIHFTGVDLRAHLVQVARALSHRLRTLNTDFVAGDATRMPWSDFDGFYFFNPFEENVFVPRERIDSTIELSSRRFAKDVVHVSKSLESARVGTLMVTYHGFGGAIPSTYEIVGEEAAGSDVLRIWKKRAGDAEPWCHVEAASGVTRVERRRYEDALGQVCASS